MNTPDIDIERLREAVEDAPNLYDNAGDIATLVRAARLLVSLADQGGELWMETSDCDECKGVGMVPFLGPSRRWVTCGACLGYGGSRVRVWPKGAQ